MMTRDELRDADWVVVLNDDEAYTDLVGCTFTIVDAAVQQELDEGNDTILSTLRKYDMATLLHWTVDRGFFDDLQPTEASDC